MEIIISLRYCCYPDDEQAFKLARSNSLLDFFTRPYLPRKHLNRPPRVSANSVRGMSVKLTRPFEDASRATIARVVFFGGRRPLLVRRARGSKLGAYLDMS